MSVFIGCRELSLSIVVSVVELPENVFLMAHDSLLECVRNAPSDSDGDLPLVIWHLWRDFPRCVRHHVLPPCLWKTCLLEVSSICSNYGEFPFIELMSWELLCCQTNSYMQTMVFKECKAYVCLDVLKMQFFSKIEFCKDVISTQDL